MTWSSDMKRRDFFGLLACASASTLGASASASAPSRSALDAAGQLRALPMDPTADGFAWTHVAEGVQFRVAGMTKSVLFYGPGLVRVAAHLGEAYTSQPSLVVVGRPKPVALAISDSADTLTVAGPAMRVTVDKRSGALAFFRADGQLLTRERERAPTELQRI